MRRGTPRRSWFEFAQNLRHTHAVKCLGLLVIAFALAGCAMAAPRPPAVASPDAPIGRLAGAPSALRPGVAGYTDLPAPHADAPPVRHHHP